MRFLWWGSGRRGLRPRRSPTDLEILEVIYLMYHDTFGDYDREKPTRAAKIFVPVDIDEVARRLDVDPHLVWGRLYYDLEKRYGYDRPSGTRVAFFSPVVGEDRDGVNFPYLSSVVAALQDERRRRVTATSVAVLSLVVATISLWVSLATQGG